MQELAGIPDAGCQGECHLRAGNRDGRRKQWSPEQSRDIAKLNDPETLAGLKAKAPDVDWALMLKNVRTRQYADRC